MKLIKNISTPMTAALGSLLLVSALGCSQGGRSEMNASGTSMKAMSHAKVTISPSPVPYRRKVKVTISGSGFAPHQELELLMPIGGVPSDISTMVKPKPKTDANGAFSTVWILNNEIRGHLLEPTTYTLEVSNSDGEVLARTPFVFKRVENTKK